MNDPKWQPGKHARSEQLHQTPQNKSRLRQRASMFLHGNITGRSAYARMSCMPLNQKKSMQQRHGERACADI